MSARSAFWRCLPFTLSQMAPLDGWPSLVAGTSSLVECAAAFFTRRDDGYYFSRVDPRTSTEDIRLKYAYPAEVGSQYVIEPPSAAVSGEASWATGKITVTVLATDEPIDTPWGMKSAYRYRFDIETFFKTRCEPPHPRGFVLSGHLTANWTLTFRRTR
jgi:hypothetical protein